jgi:acyl-CoA thioester hydrolase
VNASPEALAGYPFVLPITVRFRDLDTLAHVNNAVYLTYFEMGRIAYYQQLTGRTGAETVGFVVAHISVDFRAPLLLGDTLLLGVRATGMRSKSFSVAYSGVRESDGRLIVSGESVQVAYDQSLGRSVHIPDDVRELLRAEVARAEDGRQPG